ncbi:PucR family transcriptional regulator [Emergencia timonensis]|uniref:PucR family transcriptional regulator n=1 Tax=Emergencia timonensis TaxID=1776384 RepID=UPI003994A275
MSITVADCLKLPSLREAKVIAGAGGINRDVSCVSVLEHVDLFMLEQEGFFLGSQIIISALTSIKDDIEAQCKLIQLLSDSGEVGLILYYVGIFVKEVNPKVIEIADKLDFPLIMMPPNRYNHRYSDFISEAMRIITDNQRQEISIVPNIINQIVHLKAHNRNIETVLRILSDRLRCSLLLADWKGNVCGFAPWPFGAEWDEPDLDSIVELRLRNPHFSEPVEMHINGMDAKIYCATLDIENQKGYFIAGIDEGSTLNTAYLPQIAETLLLVSTIWENTFKRADTDILLEAILNNRPAEMERIAQSLHLDISSFDTIWILCRKEKKQDVEDNMGWLAAKLSAFLKGNEKTALVDVFKDYVVAFIDAANNPFAEFPQEFIDEVLCDEQKGLILCSSTWHDHKSTEEVCSSFLLTEENIETACKIFPYQNVFTCHGLYFVKTCREILESSETDLKTATKILQPLLKDSAGRDVLDTLTVFLLDCQGNILETSSRLFIHKNTVKYRIKKSERLLGIDLLKMPEVMSLYTALALSRLIEY